MPTNLRQFIQFQLKNPLLIVIARLCSTSCSCSTSLVASLNLALSHEKDIGACGTLLSRFSCHAGSLPFGGKAGGF